MKPRPILAAAAIVGGAAFLALQWVPTPQRVNPAVRAEQTIHANLALPEQISGILNKACRNCHSNETQWPWYSRVAPGSWAVARDVTRARKAMNLSEWAMQAGRTPETAVATLAAACADMRSGRMPLKGYRMMHPESRLRPDEINGFCEWTEQQTHSLLFGKREQQRRAAAASKDQNVLHQ